MTDLIAPTPAGADPVYGSKPYRAYILFALVLVYTFNFIDRVLVAIVQEDIRGEFHLSDTQLGLLGGPTFAVLYTLLGIPIARLAERHNRTTIVSVCVGLWSVMTALCGLTANYVQLLSARIGVSIGEAGATPPAQSIIADYFPPEKRASASSIYALGAPVGSMLAAIGGGYIAAYFGWRSAFLMLGLPGLALAILFKITVREPARATPAAHTPSLAAGFAALARKWTFWNVALGAAAASFTGYGVGQFTNSFFIRNHSADLQKLAPLAGLLMYADPAHPTPLIFRASLITGLLIGLCGGAGAVLCGLITDKISKRHPNALVWLPALGFILAAPLNILGYMTQTLALAVALLAGGLLFQYFYLGSMYAVAQGVVHPRMRATATAILLFIVNLIGYALGPPAIGALSDVLANTQLAPLELSVEACKLAVGQAHRAACDSGAAYGLRWAIVLGFLGYIWAAIHFLLAWPTLRKDWVG